MRPRIRQLMCSAIAVGCLVVLSVDAQGANLKVHCGGKEALSTINGALKLLNPGGRNTITVSGTCKENVLVVSFDRLTLMAQPGTSISDASGGASAVIIIADSNRITLEGFKINGGGLGVLCVDFSLCRFKSNTIEGVKGDGVLIVQSHATFEKDLIQDNAGNGLYAITSVVTASGVIIQRNQKVGATADTGSTLNLANSNVNSNGQAVNASGVRALGNSLVELTNDTITANDANGVRLFQSSVGRFDSGNVITSNGAPGVSIEDLSFAQFDPQNAITGNPSFDVACLAQFSATRGALTNIGGGITNCVEP